MVIVVISVSRSSLFMIDCVHIICLDFAIIPVRVVVRIEDLGYHRDAIAI